MLQTQLIDVFKKRIRVKSESKFMRILFISNTQRLEDPYKDHSTRYRCFHFSEELCRLGFSVGIVPLATIQLSVVDNYDFVVFHRPLYSKKLIKLLNRLRSHGKSFCADFDDLLFCLDSVDMSPQVLNGRMSERSVTRRAQRYLKALLLFERVTVSTAALAKEVRGYHEKAVVCVVSNGLSQKWRESNSEHSNRSEVFRIGYFPGTSSHADDFEQISESLLDFIDSYSGTEFFLVGPLALPDIYMRHPRVKSVQPVPYEELGTLIRQCAVTIAPLAATRFNQCKSNIKLLESIACGVPLVATANRDFDRLGGSYFYPVRDPADWRMRLEQAYVSWKKGKEFLSPEREDLMASSQLKDLLLGWGLPRGIEALSEKAERGGVQVLGTLSASEIRLRKVQRKFNKLLRNPMKFFKDSWCIKCFKS